MDVGDFAKLFLWSSFRVGEILVAHSRLTGVILHARLLLEKQTLESEQISL